MKIRKGDKVIVISGKDKGVTGKVLHAYPKSDKVISRSTRKAPEVPSDVS